MNQPARQPFRLVPWDLPFLDHLRDDVMRATDNQPGRAVVVFPHDRPKRYFLPLLQRPGRACLPPRLLTVGELMTALRRELSAPAALRREAGMLDQAALLHACVLELRDTDPAFRERLAELSQLDASRFFPWGVRLAGVFEACFSGGLEPYDLEHTEGEVADFAASLLSALGRLFRLYRQALDTHGLTTPGLEAFAATEPLRRAESLPLPAFLHNRTLVLAGFNARNGTEDLLFRHLWHHGALICLHGHPDLAQGRRPAGCGSLADWIADWQTSCELVAPPSGTTPEMHFFAGHDLHSQIAALRSDLDAIPGLFTPTARTTPDASDPEHNDADETPSLAVALTHADALLPVLHHLPARNCNVSLGYPLDRSLLSDFLTTILELRATRTGTFAHAPDAPDHAAANDPGAAQSKVHWRVWSSLLRHPCLRMLQADGGELRQALRALEAHTRQGTRFLNPHDHLPAVLGTVSPPTQALLQQILALTVDAFTGVHTTAELAEALSNLCQLLLERGEHLWPRFPLDAECLFRIMRHVIPALRHNLLAERPLPWPLLEAMVRSLLEAERVPFEADPLTGVQVLGMLETRLLHFERVFLVDATEAHLPGPPDLNPLLPDALRRVLGLPGSHQREELAAYTFHRLLAGARHVHLYWQEDEAGTQRSRLVEDRIWREEQRLGRLLRAGEPPLRTPRVQISPLPQRLRPVVRTPEINARMDALMARPLSPTTLDAYLTCPLRFYYERLCRISPMDEVNEGDDAPAVGTLLHEALRAFYQPYLGRVYRPQAPQNEAQRLADLFQDALTQSDLLASLPPESGAMLRIAGPERLRRFLENQPPQPCILHLEHSLTARYSVGHRDFTLTGTLDRVDARMNPLSDSLPDPLAAGAPGGVDPDGDDTPLRHIHILDYKTGTVRLPAPSLWADTGLFSALAEAVSAPLPPTAEAPLFLHLAQKLPSLQLPMYLALYRAATSRTAHNAACVQLAENGEEMPLFPDAMTEADREAARTFAIPALLSYVLRHMAQCDVFFPRPDRHCDWCSVNKLCRI